MKVTDIRYQPVNPIETKAFRNAEVLKKSETVLNNSSVKVVQDPSWQKNILLDAIQNLENNIQTDNNHPLSRADYAPIESLDEAMIELAWFKTPFFQAQGVEAQANLTAEDIAALFVE